MKYQHYKQIITVLFVMVLCFEPISHAYGKTRINSGLGVNVGGFNAGPPGGVNLGGVNLGKPKKYHRNGTLQYKTPGPL